MRAPRTNGCQGSPNPGGGDGRSDGSPDVTHDVAGLVGHGLRVRTEEVGADVGLDQPEGCAGDGTVENPFFRYKSMIGDRLRARHLKP